MWSRVKIEHSITSVAIKQKLRLGLETHEPCNRTGPLAFKILMNELIQCSVHTRSSIKQAWLYGMTPTDYDGGSITQFTSDWRNIRIFLEALGDDVSDSARQLYQALTSCPNGQFSNHFRTLSSMQDKGVDQEDSLIIEANAQYRKLTAEGKWTVRSKKEHSAFRQKKKAEADKVKANKASKANANTNKQGDATKNPKANQTKKTHDAQGHPIDRTPPKDGEPKKRVNPLTKKDQWFCEDPHCLRWGNHDTAGHEAWYKKLLESKKTRKDDNKDKALESASTSGTANPLQIPAANFSGQSRE